MANINDVAEKAKVSAMTVSRVINKSGYVKEETRKRILRAMKELDYVPNGLARSLTQQKTNTLALIVPDITNPFYTSVVRGTEDKARKHGYRIVLCNSDEDVVKEQEYVDMSLSIRVDGVIIAPAHDGSIQSLKKLRKHDVPFVLLDRDVPGIKADLVKGDSDYGTRQLLHHLISQGHERIAIVTGKLNVSTSRERLNSYKQVHQEMGLIVRECYIKESTYFRTSQYQIVKDLLACDEKPTAIFAANNIVAAGLIQNLKEFNIKVPEDISIVCFDDVDPLSIAEPFLTVAMQPAYEEGSVATQFLLDVLDNTVDPSSAQPRTIVLLPNIMFRRSSNSN